MATPVRRSARLRTTPGDTPMRSPSLPRMPSVPETDPKTPPSHTTPVKPSLEEMHPSKVQTSTTKQPDSGLRLGFKPIPKAPQHAQAAAASTATPTKSRLSHSRPDLLESGSPSWKPISGDRDSTLSDEARRLMESLREDAARIRAQMALESRSHKCKRDSSAADGTGERRIKSAHGKTGRFSDVHMAQFRKMDSIENHPSAFRVRSPVIATPKQGIKRKSIEDDKASTPSTPTTPSRIAKVSKKTSTTDISARHGHGAAPAAASPSRTTVRVRFGSRPMTPKRPTVARASSAHPAKTRISMLPPQLVAKSATGEAEPSTPRPPQTEFNPKFKSNIPSLPHLKSILRKRQPLFSTDPRKIAAGTHVAPPNGHADFDSKLIGLDETESDAPSTRKRVDFSASTKLRHAFTEMSPVPLKIDPQPKNTEGHLGFATVAYPELPPVTPPSIKGSPSLRAREAPNAASQSGINTFPDQPESESESESVGDFRFSFGNNANNTTPSPTKSKHVAFAADPVSAMAPVRFTSPAIRSVRPRRQSINLPAASSSTADTGPDVAAAVGGIPHGLINKKRHRDDHRDDDAGVENRPLQETAARSKKRLKTATPFEKQASKPITTTTTTKPASKSVTRRATVSRQTPGTPSRTPSRVLGTPSRIRAGSIAPSSGVPGSPSISASAQKKGMERSGGLTMSRLNALAQPKIRR